MKVKELVALLLAQDQELTVVRGVDNLGYEDISEAYADEVFDNFKDGMQLMAVVIV